MFGILLMRCRGQPTNVIGELLTDPQFSFKNQTEEQFSSVFIKNGLVLSVQFDAVQHQFG